MATSFVAMADPDFLLSPGFVEISFTKSFASDHSSDLPLPDAFSELDVVPISLLVGISSDFSFDSNFQKIHSRNYLCFLNRLPSHGTFAMTSRIWSRDRQW
jgi:hypothetical protein